MNQSYHSGQKQLMKNSFVINFVCVSNSVETKLKVTYQLSLKIIPYKNLMINQQADNYISNLALFPFDIQAPNTIYNQKTINACYRIRYQKRKRNLKHSKCNMHKNQLPEWSF